MSTQTASLKKSLPLVLLAAMALQLTACKEEKTTSSAKVAGSANPNTKKAAEEKAKADAKKASDEKSGKKEDDSKTPAPDKVPAVNTSGNAYVGSLADASNSGNEKLSSICSLELVEQDGKKLAFLSIGGYNVKMPLLKEWVKDSQSFDEAGIKASSSKIESINVDKTTEIFYKVQSASNGAIEIRREIYFVEENALGSKDLKQFIQDERKKLYEDKDYKGMTLVTDYLNIDATRSFSAYTYVQNTLVPGTGTPEKGQNGKSINAACEGLVSEKK